ncbi:hypothetical protein VNO77_02362 [Canavalia gladiata]|uniref:Uncharacterized protein n=1 Tax=Canavalia gladiata TaxID=3824 RepID=A0AAN9MXT4_CANGL
MGCRVNNSLWFVYQLVCVLQFFLVVGMLCKKLWILVWYLRNNLCNDLSTSCEGYTRIICTRQKYVER